MATKELDDSSIHVVNKSITDTVSNNVDQASMKSRSPVSLEIYMPSITGKYSEIQKLTLSYEVEISQIN